MPPSPSTSAAPPPPAVLPARSRPERFRRGWLVVVTGTLLFVALASLPPFVEGLPRVVLMRMFSGVCHQIAERSPHLHGVPLAVCHRCYGIYWGLVAGAFAFAWLRRWDGRIDRSARVLIPAALLVPGVDWLGGVAGLWTNTPATRLATGAVFGLVAGYFLARAVVGLFTAPKRT